MKALWSILVGVWVVSCGAADLHELARLGDVAKMTAAIAEDRRGLSARDDVGQTVLHAAVAANHPKMVRRLLLAGVDPNALDGDYQTALDLCSSSTDDSYSDPWDSGTDPFSSESSDASVNAESEFLELDNGEVPYAAESSAGGAVERVQSVVELLRESGGRFGSQVISCFHELVVVGDVYGVREALDREPRLLRCARAQPSQQIYLTKKQEALRVVVPAMAAVEAGQRDVLALLLERGVSPNETDPLGLPLSYLAIGAGHPALARQLLAAGAADSLQMRTMLWDFEGVRSMIANGADPNAVDILHSRALDWAVAFGYSDMAAWLKVRTRTGEDAADLRRQADALRHSIKTYGLPADADGLNAWTPKPAGRNAADLVEAYESRQVDATWYEIMPREDRERVPLEGRRGLPLYRARIMEGETLRISQQYLLHQTEQLEMLAAASAIRHAHFGMNFYSASATTLLPHLNQFRRYTRTLSIQASVRLAQGDASGAGDAVRQSLILDQMLRNEPLLVSQLVRFACQRTTLESLERVLSQSAPGEAMLEILARELDASRPEDVTLRSEVAELFMGRRYFAEDLDGLLDGLGVFALPAQRAMYKQSRAVAKDELLYAEACVRSISALRRPPRQALLDCGEHDAWQRQLPVCSFLTRTIIGEFTLEGRYGMYARELEAKMRVDCARAAVAAARYRLKEGVLPHLLAALVPTYLDEVPQDWFGIGPLQYRQAGDAFVVESVARRKGQAPIAFRVGGD